MLAPGTRLGSYEIIAPLGAGGMGEVYRARDSRLSRDVAIKALPAGVAQDPERLARFDREAKLLASLNHPNIGAIYGLEEVDGQRYLVLEFVEGETLAQRLSRGPLPIAEALEVCSQVASALEAAHESGIVHRDLKPGNVMRTSSGAIKVLDFGLAKGGASASMSDPSLSISPTVTYAGTAAGVVLGTAAYMSPEQARGRAVDKRTDIWSFGCVLFECLTGRQTFQGETVSDLIARILERDPDWSALPAGTPASIRELLQRCLEKDVRQRLRDIGDARIAIERERALGSGAVRAAAGAQAAARRRGLVTAWAALLAGVLIGGGSAWMARGGRLAGGPTTAQLTMDIPDSLSIQDGDWSATKRAMVLICRRASEVDNPLLRIYVRSLDDFTPHLVPGTEGVTSLRITNDGRWIVFVGQVAPNSPDRRLARIPLDGSAPPITVSAWDPAWHSFALLSNGDIVVMDQPGTKMWRIPASGGATVESKVDRGDLRASVELEKPAPGDRIVFLRAAIYEQRGWSVQIGALDLAKNRLVTFGQEGGFSALAPGGELLFSRGEVLLAAPFDASRLKVAGAPVAVASGLWAPFSYYPGYFLLDREGTLIYPPGGAVGDQRRIGIVDAEGRLRKLSTEPRPYQRYPVPARDGKTFFIPATNAAGIDEIWMGDLERAGLRKVVAEPNADCTLPHPSPDGRHLAYWRVGRDSSDGTYIMNLESGGPGRLVIPDPSSQDQYAIDQWSPDGEWLILTRVTNGRLNGLYAARLSTSADSVVAVRKLTAGSEAAGTGALSADGRWLAYQSDESGRDEIYVAPFHPEGSLGAAIRLTDGGGGVPEWLAPGRLAYRSPDIRHLYVMEVGSPPTAGIHPARDWCNLDEIGVLDGSVMPDGTFLAKLRGPHETGGGSAVNLVFGWTDELKRRLAAR